MEVRFSTCLRYFFTVFLVSASSISKGLRQKAFQNRHGWRWFQAEASSHCELVVEQCTGTYTVQQSISKGLRLGVSALLLKMFSVSEAAWMPLVLRSNKFWNKTCPPPMYMDVHRWRGTRTYTVQQSISKGLRQKDFIQQFLWHIFIRMKHLGR